jgi:hypothetical protein
MCIRVALLESNHLSSGRVRYGLVSVIVTLAEHAACSRCRMTCDAYACITTACVCVCFTGH